MTDQLIEIPQSEWLRLRDLFKKDWPLNIFGHRLVDSFHGYTIKRPLVRHVHIYSLNGDWQDGTIIGVFRYQVFVTTLNPSLDRLARAMALLEWKRGYLVCQLLEQYLPAWETAAKIAGLHPKLAFENFLYHFPASESLKLDVTCPPGITLNPLTSEHSDMIVSSVGKLFSVSHGTYSAFLDLCGGIGAFDETGKLLAFVLGGDVPITFSTVYKPIETTRGLVESFQSSHCSWSGTRTRIIGRLRLQEHPGPKHDDDDDDDADI